MGLMRLFVHDAKRLAGLEPSRVHMVGFEELPWFGRVFISDKQLVIERPESDSGAVCVPWSVRERGELLLATATLMEREAPYFLEVELARGVNNRVRNQLAAWQQLGLQPTEELLAEVRAATHAFCQAAARMHDPPAAAAAAEQAIDLGAAAADRLAACYAEQALGHRLSMAGRLNTLLGVGLSCEVPPTGVQQPIVDAFQLVAVPAAWRTVEASEGERHWKMADEQVRWAQQNKLRVVGGPLLEFDERRVPDWTYLWEGDFDTLSALMIDHVRNVVQRYRGKIHIWHVASRLNRPHVLSLNDEDRLQVVAMAIRAVRELDPRTPVVVSFDQPWAEYMATQQVDLAPVHYADALVRADLGLSGLGLEMNVGPQPWATAPRLPIDFSRLIDQWGQFELPLFLQFTVDNQTSHGLDQARGGGDGKTTSGRADWVERHLPTILAKNSVQVVLWNQLSDRGAEFPHAGLFDDHDQPKPVFNALQGLRKQFLP